MKIPRKRLELRPIQPAFLNIIPRLPAMVSKNEIILKILSPITFIFRNIKNIFKKRPSLQRIQEQRKVQTHGKKITSTSCDEGVDAVTQDKRAIPDSCGDFTRVRRKRKIPNYFFNERKMANMFPKVRVRKDGPCLSCQEDRPAYHTCSMCKGLDSALPASSCEKCQKEGPLVNLCLRYHNRQPVIYIAEGSKNQDVCKRFGERRVLRRVPARDCNGKHPTINNCPMCSSIWPTAGECNCAYCKSTQPVIKFYAPKCRNSPVVYVCPCPKCAHLHPKIKLCDSCRAQKNSKLRKDTSFYMILP